jgi:hypothetical protein
MPRCLRAARGRLPARRPAASGCRRPPFSDALKRACLTRWRRRSVRAHHRARPALDDRAGRCAALDVSIHAARAARTRRPALADRSFVSARASCLGLNPRICRRRARRASGHPSRLQATVQSACEEQRAHRILQVFVHSHSAATARAFATGPAVSIIESMAIAANAVTSTGAHTHRLGLSAWQQRQPRSKSLSCNWIRRSRA